MRATRVVSSTCASGVIVAPRLVFTAVAAGDAVDMVGKRQARGNGDSVRKREIPRAVSRRSTGGSGQQPANSGLCLLIDDLLLLVNCRAPRFFCVQLDETPTHPRSRDRLNVARLLLNLVAHGEPVGEGWIGVGVAGH